MQCDCCSKQWNWEWEQDCFLDNENNEPTTEDVQTADAAMEVYTCTCNNVIGIAVDTARGYSLFTEHEGEEV